MSPLMKKASVIAVMLALGGLATGCGSGSSSSSTPIGDNGNGNGEPPVVALLDADGLFEIAANMNDLDGVEATLAGAPEDAAANEAVLAAIDDVLSNLGSLVPVGLASMSVMETRDRQTRQQHREQRRSRAQNSDSLTLAFMEPQVPEGPVACFQDQGTVEVVEAIEFNEEYGEEEESGSWGITLARSVEFVNCAVPMYLDSAPNGNNGMEMTTMIVPPNILMLSGSMSVSFEEFSEWQESENGLLETWEMSVDFATDLAGDLDEREGAFALSGNASLALEDVCTWSPDETGSCVGTEVLDFPRMETLWEPIAGERNYFGKLNLQLNERFEDEWSEGRDYWSDEFSISGRVAASAMGGSLDLNTVKPVFTEEEYLWTPRETVVLGLEPAAMEYTPVCPQSGILELGAAELRFGEDTGVSGVAVQFVTASGESENWACGDSEIDEIGDFFGAILDEPTAEYLLEEVGSGYPYMMY